MANNDFFGNEEIYKRTAERLRNIVPVEQREDYSTGNALGISGIITGIILPVPGLVLLVIGLVLTYKNRDKFRTKTARILTIAGIITAIAAVIVHLMLFIFILIPQMLVQ